MKRRFARWSNALAVSSVSILVGALSIAAAPPTAPAFVQSWLDTDTANWNQSGATLPAAPPQEATNFSYCTDSSTLRQATLPEDRLVKAAGWTLFGSAQMFGSTTIVTAMANVDGMCRPLAYQAFVFHDGQFVGTLSPSPMDARSDSSLQTNDLYAESEIMATFSRYTDADALCCPSAESLVFYTLEPTTNGAFVLVPQLPASTSPNF